MDFNLVARFDRVLNRLRINIVPADFYQSHICSMKLIQVGPPYGPRHDSCEGTMLWESSQNSVFWKRREDSPNQVHEDFDESVIRHLRVP